MVKIFFHRSNMFYSNNKPAYIVLDTEGDTIRLKCYQGAYVYLDDTQTGTNRTGVQIIQLWSTYPFPLPPSVGAGRVNCEVYDTANNLIDMKRVWFYVGQPRRRIYLRDEQGNPLTLNYCVVFTDVGLIEQVGYDCGRGSEIIDPWGSTLTTIIEIWSDDIGRGKRYFIGYNTDIQPPDSDVAMTPPLCQDKCYVRVVYKVDNSVINAMLKAPLFGEVAGYLINNLSWVISNAPIALARFFSERAGIRFPIRNARIYTEAGELLLDVEYEVDPFPAILAVVIAAGAGGLVIGLLFSGAIKRIFSEIRATFTVVSYYEYQRQRLALLQDALNKCQTDECRRQVLETLHLPDPNSTIAEKSLDQLKAETTSSSITAGVVGALAGVIGGALLYRYARRRE